MKIAYKIIILICLVSCSNKKEQSKINSTISSDILEFYETHFKSDIPNSNLFELSKDSLEIKGLDITLFSIKMSGSHPTDQIIIRDNLTKRIFQYAKYNYYIQSYLNEHQILEILHNNLECRFYDAICIERVLNQVERKSSKPINLNQLDSIISFHQNQFTNRIESLSELDSALSIIYNPDSTKIINNDIIKIKNYLSEKLDENKILIYRNLDHYLDVYEINPNDEFETWEYRTKLYERNDSKRFTYALLNTHLKRTKIGKSDEKK
jgi:hypothetical protein